MTPAEEERAAIVRYLRDCIIHDLTAFASGKIKFDDPARALGAFIALAHTAYAIEQGEHLKEQPA